MQLSLSVEQKSKLLEMLKALAPSKYNCWLTKGEKEYEKNHIVFCTNDNKVFTIHWLEYTMTELIERVYGYTPTKSSIGLKDKLKDFYWNLSCYCPNPVSTNPIAKHPIDYLYSIFEKLH